MSTATASPSLTWSTELHTGDGRMDDTHAEFVEQLNTLLATPVDQQLPLYRAFLAHTQDHFDQEDRWMLDTGFAPGSCHMTQHAVVLKVLREGLASGLQGQLQPIRQMAHELTLWFPHHAQNMDAGLALHLKSVGYDPLTRAVAQPEALPQEAISGCGGACSSQPAEAQPAAV